MGVEWQKDADAALAAAKESKKGILFDFNAAPV
jgi:hypothetical protein